MDWITVSLQWYLCVLVIGIVFTPLTKRLFGSFIDYGYPFAKILGIILISYAAYVGGVLRILPFNAFILYGTVIGFALLNYFIKTKAKTGRPAKGALPAVLLGEEVLFLISLLFLTYVRGQEPSIHGLEKFMDYGFINSILRSTYFPPLDMWYPPEPINYYFFGHLSGATLIKLSGVAPAIGYNLLLATIFALSMTATFSITANIIHFMHRRLRPALIFGVIGAFLTNLAGNLHTIYLFTKGYPNEDPVPFWTIFSKFNPDTYWYPNATRFIPYTIHEFPSYSYVVADLHGHVFDIPFVLATLALSFVYYLACKTKKDSALTTMVWPAGFGFMIAVHYMTNAFDGPIYLLLIGAVYLLTSGFSKRLFLKTGVTVISFLTFSLPFNYFFKPFSSAIGVNCAPQQLVKMGKIGPFLFENGNCQVSPAWMLFVLWGFFLISFITLLIIRYLGLGEVKNKAAAYFAHSDNYITFLFLFGFILIIIPEFVYAKDIYPGHFRANTMFKLGYQAFTVMSIASAVVLHRVAALRERPPKIIFKAILLPLVVLVLLYPFFSFRSYYGDLKKKPQLDGTVWMKDTMPQDYELVKYMNKNITGQPVILEAQGDSYTDYERISANTGLATVAGWQVHEWLWRGSADIVGDRIPDIQKMYESADIAETRKLLHKYDVSYVIISQLEREKYKNLDEKKFEQIGRKIYTSSNGFGALYQVK